MERNFLDRLSIVEVECSVCIFYRVICFICSLVNTVSIGYLSSFLVLVCGSGTSKTVLVNCTNIRNHSLMTCILGSNTLELVLDGSLVHMYQLQSRSRSRKVGHIHTLNLLMLTMTM